MSPEQSMSGWMLRLVEGRPTRMLRRDRGTTAGSPREGHDSSLCWAAYQSGSTHTSVTHCTGTGGATDGAAGPEVADGASGAVNAGPSADGPGAGASGGSGAVAGASGPRSSALGAPSPSG